jgi:hypothetical protein
MTNGAEQLGRFQARIENIGRCDGIVQPFQEFAAQGGLAGTNLPGDDGEALAMLQCVTQVGQCDLVASAQEEIGRIGNQLEGLFTKSEKGIVHQLLFTMPRCSCDPQLQPEPIGRVHPPIPNLPMALIVSILQITQRGSSPNAIFKLAEHMQPNNGIGIKIASKCLHLLSHSHKDRPAKRVIGSPAFESHFTKKTAPSPMKAKGP